ncbi:hypothetical protein [Micromonospora sp. NPDC005206]|uniref:hypothetical protein n=1 Tax=Micromonospora sp. NPDC005206 TaxID=3157022 RepID=UPI0033BE4C72
MERGPQQVLQRLVVRGLLQACEHSFDAIEVRAEADLRRKLAVADGLGEFEEVQVDPLEVRGRDVLGVTDRASGEDNQHVAFVGLSDVDELGDSLDQALAHSRFGDFVQAVQDEQPGPPLHPGSQRPRLHLSHVGAARNLVGDPPQQSRVVAEPSFLGVQGQVDAHRPAAVLRQLTAEALQGCRGALDDVAVPVAEVFGAFEHGRAEHLDEELGDRRLAVAGRAGDDHVPGRLLGGDAGSEDMFGAVEHVLHYARTPRAGGEGDGQVDGDVVDGDPLAVTAARLVEVDETLAHERGLGVLPEPFFEVLQRYGVGELCQRGEDVAGGEEPRKRVADARVHLEQGLDLVAIPDTHLLDALQPGQARPPLLCGFGVDLPSFVGKAL